jgi:hypothetical protein
MAPDKVANVYINRVLGTREKESPDTPQKLSGIMKQTAKERQIITDIMRYHGLDYDSFKSLGDYEACVEAMESLTSHQPDSPTDDELAIEIIARFSGNSRGTPIAKKGFIDGVIWARDTYHPKVDLEKLAELFYKSYPKDDTYTNGIVDWFQKNTPLYSTVNFEELIDAVAVELQIIKALISGKTVVNLDESIAYYEKLIKENKSKL